MIGTTAAGRSFPAHMKRAQTARICVDLDFRYAKSLAEARAIMQALHAHLSRCFSFRVSVPDWDWMAVVAEQCGNMHEGLEALALRIDPGDNEDVVPVPLLTGTFPRLRILDALRKFHSALAMAPELKGVYIQSETLDSFGVSRHVSHLIDLTLSRKGIFIESRNVREGGFAPFFDETHYGSWKSSDAGTFGTSTAATTWSSQAAI